MLRAAGPPPRPSEPPLPWKKISRTPYSCATRESTLCVLYRDQQAARYPPSFVLSEYPIITI